MNDNIIAEATYAIAALPDTWRLLVDVVLDRDSAVKAEVEQDLLTLVVKVRELDGLSTW